MNELASFIGHQLSLCRLTFLKNLNQLMSSAFSL
ncbi:hypothetical protein sync_1517 [Synechococcus sp. CC9311]|nr:hypothetical protein sync_1517 [Synechococcus sp. CC9311]